VDDRTVLGRALEIVQAVVDHGPHVTLAELTARSGLPKPTVRRIAGDLVRRRVLERVADGYALGTRLAELGTAAAAQRRYAGARPALAELHARCGGIAWLTAGPKLSQLHPVEVACDPSLRALVRTSWPPPDTVDSLANTAGGHVVLAQRPDLMDVLAERGWAPWTPNSPSDLRGLRASLRSVRDTGAAVEVERSRIGWQCVAVEVEGRAGEPAVLGVTMPTAQGRLAPVVRAVLELRESVGAGLRVS
jgi:DNA-binding IclR family transcriptional regulator